MNLARCFTEHPTEYIFRHELANKIVINQKVYPPHVSVEVTADEILFLTNCLEKEDYVIIKKRRWKQY